MSFNHIFGQEKPKQIIKNAIQNNSLAHAYLFYGQESIGKKLIAFELAKTLNCTSLNDGEPCSECSSCKKITNNTHPDFFFIGPTKNIPTAREATIKIEVIRELQRKLIFKPYEGKVKVAVIDDVDLMNLQAANSFLKTLEEPPTSTILILISSHPFRLLPTILSRCQTILFQPLSPEDIKKILQEKIINEDIIDEKSIEFRTLRSQGNVNKALREDIEDIANIRNEILALLETVSFQRMDVVFSHAKSWAKQVDQWEIIFNELMELLRDLAFFCSGCSDSHIFNRDIATELKPLATKRNLNSWIEMFNSAHNTQKALAGNANAQLFFENMLIDFCEAS